MFEVTRYEHPYVFVTCRGTGETYRFPVGDDGALADDGLGFETAGARRKAIQYLFEKRLSVESAELLRLSA